MHNKRRSIFTKLLVLNMLLTLTGQIKSQISDIKDLASGAGDLFSGCAASDVSAGCDAMSCCWDGGFYFFDFLIDHHREILDMRYLDPCLLSLELDGNIAYAFHYNADSSRYYHYGNLLPRIRGNLGIFSLDFRYNILAQYSDDVPDSYKSWELLFMLNFVPVDGFKMSLGTGVFYEMFTEKYYNEHYFNMQFGVLENKDFIDLDCRAAVDYNTSVFPFIEAGIKYRIRFISLNHVYAYFSLGGFYQNYYQSHDIWAGSAGLMLNIH